MTNDTPRKFTVVPHQDYVTFEVWDDTLHITQENFAEGDVTITVIGKRNLEALIAGLEAVKEEWA